MRAKAYLCALALLALAFPRAGASSIARQYAARQTGEIWQLEDNEVRTIVSILPGVGNIVFGMKVNGHEILHWPYTSIDEFKKRPGLSGIPLLAPWANRLDEQAFYANGKRYAFDATLGNVRSPIPIHGFLATTNRWQVLENDADAQSASLTSRLDFFREPAWMKQWPFAHTITTTYRLERGGLEVRTAIGNLSNDPMPIAIGFHPYFRLSDTPRNEWTLSVGARERWLLTVAKLPTGQTEPVDRFFPNPKSVPLAGYGLDDVFADLERDAAGRATMTVKGKAQSIEVVVGPKFRAVVLYAPKNGEFVCIEPMAAVTNGVNLAHKGLYRELQSVAPGETWEESFWIRPRGF